MEKTKNIDKSIYSQKNSVFRIVEIVGIEAYIIRSNSGAAELARYARNLLQGRDIE